MGKIFIFMYRLLFKSLRRKITSEVKQSRSAFLHNTAQHLLISL